MAKKTSAFVTSFVLLGFLVSLPAFADTKYMPKPWGEMEPNRVGIVTRVTTPRSCDITKFVYAREEVAHPDRRSNGYGFSVPATFDIKPGDRVLVREAYWRIVLDIEGHPYIWSENSGEGINWQLVARIR